MVEGSLFKKLDRTTMLEVGEEMKEEIMVVKEMIGVAGPEEVKVMGVVIAMEVVMEVDEEGEIAMVREIDTKVRI